MSLTRIASILVCGALLISAVVNVEPNIAATFDRSFAARHDLARPGWLYALPYWLTVFGAVLTLLRMKYGVWLLCLGLATYWLGFVWLYLPFVDVEIDHDAIRLLAIYSINTATVLVAALPQLSEFVRSQKGSAA